MHKMSSVQEIFRKTWEFAHTCHTVLRAELRVCTVLSQNSALNPLENMAVLLEPVFSSSSQLTSSYFVAASSRSCAMSSVIVRLKSLPLSLIQTSTVQ